MQQGLKPESVLVSVLARLKPCRCYKAEGKARVRRKDFGPGGVKQGLKPEDVLESVMARLKPCRCYKAHEQALLDFAWVGAGAKARGCFGERFWPGRSRAVVTKQKGKRVCGAKILGQTE
jgi:hypothetical protein